MDSLPDAPPPGSAAALANAKRKSRGRKALLLAAMALIALGIGGYRYSKREKPPTITVEPAVRKTIIQLVSATGKVQPETEVKISPEVAGEIIELPVVDGQAVRKGELLLKIKPDNYQAQVAQQEAAISSAKSMSLQARAQMLKTQQDFRRARDLFDKKITSDTDLLAAQTAADVAKATYEASVFDIQRAESLLKQSRDLLEKTTIFSPIDGIISQLNNKVGERVVATGQFAGTEVMRVADLEHMEVRVNVNENDVVNVKLADAANISIDAYPGRVFRGAVYQIANTAVTNGANTQEEVTNFEVRLRVPAAGAKLRPGMSATADIETATVKDAVAVPIQAVTVRNLNDKLSPEERDKLKEKADAAERAQDDNSVELDKGKALTDREKTARARLQQVVFVKVGDTVRMRAVETGIADNSSLEVKSGVKPGEEIVSGSYRAISRLLKDGAKVMLEKAG
jgi:HlyD family secretion protein